MTGPLAPPLGVEVNSVEFPAGAVRYHRAGDGGPAIVLLHGGGLDNGLLSWRHAIPTLAVDHRVYVPDLPGHGGSLPWKGRANQRTLEECLRWLLDTWNVTEITLVGLSVGASVAAGFALRHPHRVRGLVLVAADGLQPRLPKHALTWGMVQLPLAGRIAGKACASSAGLVERVLTRNVFTGSQPVSDLGQVVREVRAEARARGTTFTDWQADAIGRSGMKVNHLPHLHQIRVPTMVIHGERDVLVPVSVAQAAAGTIPGAKLRLISDAGHWPNREKPNEFNARLREFVNAQV